MIKSQSPKKDWARLLREWEIGPACQVTHARQYTVDYPDQFCGWLALADGLASLARYSEATAALRRGGRLMPSKFKHRLFQQWGLLHRERNDLRSAEKWFRRGVRAKPTTSGHVFLGAVLARQGRFTEAKAQYRLAIRRATPDDLADEAHYNLALVLRAEGNYKQAVPHLRKALAIDPRYRIAREALRDVQRVTRSLANKRMEPSRRRG
jgi:tetratricopeptide (TPR) repeat protein